MDRAESSRLSSAGDAVAAFFSGFGSIVLVANSEAVEIEALEKTYGAGALFVFFNKVYKVLDGPFESPCLLVARSGPAGANIVYRREVPEVVRLLDGPAFHGIVNLRVGDGERLSTAEEFGRADVRHLDLADGFREFYPTGQLPTSGFALALFLTERCPAQKVVLAGFTARRSAKWRLFDDHDWTFEQIVLRLLFRKGRLQAAMGSPDIERDRMAMIAERIEGVSQAEIGLVAAEVLSERLDGANSAIDGLIRSVRPLERIGAFVRALKPKTRKARLAEARKAGS